MPYSTIEERETEYRQDPERYANRNEGMGCFLPGYATVEIPKFDPVSGARFRPVHYAPVPQCNECDLPVDSAYCSAQPDMIPPLSRPDTGTSSAFK